MKEHVRYYSVDLLCGQKLYQVRFVLAEINGSRTILASTSLTLDPVSIIRLYSYRFRIECTFRELKQQAGAFCYRFWTKHMPKLSHYQKKDEPSPLEQVKAESSRKKVLETVLAIEREDIRGCGDGLSKETLFPPFESEPGIMHNADNSGTAGGYVRSL